ncbi:TPA: RDD family protein [Candidatus Poribacteria bacterium]|nr:RDD family protein [Candidatus Poribacteria bacterium]
MNWQEGSLEAEKPKDMAPEFASFGRRFLAVLIDVLIFYLIMLPGYAVLLHSSESPARSVFDLLFFLFGLAFNIWNTVYLVSRDGASIGKKLAGVVVLDADFKKLSFATALVREMIFKAISSLPFWLGFFWMLWDEKYQTWHDKLAGSYVYKADSIEMK